MVQAKELCARQQLLPTEHLADHAVRHQGTHGVATPGTRHAVPGLQIRIALGLQLHQLLRQLLVQLPAAHHLFQEPLGFPLLLLQLVLLGQALEELVIGLVDGGGLPAELDGRSCP